MGKDLNETMVRVTKDWKLVERPDVTYDREYVMNQYAIAGSEFDELQLIDSELMITIPELGFRNSEAYDKVIKIFNAFDGENELTSLLNSLDSVRINISNLKERKPELKLGYRVAPGAIINAYRECDLSFEEAVIAIEKLRLGAGNQYPIYLFSKLWHLQNKRFDDLEYDIAFDMLYDAYKDYEASAFNDDDKPEYECMAEYLAHRYSR